MEIPGQIPLSASASATRLGTVSNPARGGQTTETAEQTIAASDGAPARIPAGGFYLSPILSFDARASTVIFQVRDTESGDITRQFPSEQAVERYRRDPAQAPFVLPETGGAAGPETRAAEEEAASAPLLASGASSEGGGEPVATGRRSGETDTPGVTPPPAPAQLAPVDITA